MLARVGCFWFAVRVAVCAAIVCGGARQCWWRVGGDSELRVHLLSQRVHRGNRPARCGNVRNVATVLSCCCTMTGGVRDGQRRHSSAALVQLSLLAQCGVTHDNYSYNPSSIPSSSLRCASDTAAARFGCAAPPARRGRFRNRGAAPDSSSASAGVVSPPPFRSLSSRRKDIAAPRSAAADDGRPKVSIVYPALGGGRRGAFPFRRGFFAGRRDDGAAGAGGASREASVGGGGAAAPESV